MKSKNTRPNDKLAILLGFATSISVILGIAVFFLAGGGESIMDYIMIALTLVMVVGASFLIVKKTSNVRAGLPAEDELSKRISWKAGAYSYYASVWTAVALIWYNLLLPKILGVPELGTLHLMAFVILIPGIFFVMLSLVFARKGSV
jgi:hypothetical protein